MRLLLIIVGALAAIVSIAKPAEANWCAHYNAAGGFAVSRHIINAWRPCAGLAGPVR
jgi:hypothetical protein